MKKSAVLSFLCVLLLTMRTGVKDNANVCLTESALPGPYGKMLRIEILDYDCLRNLGVPVEKDGRTFKAKLWWDEISLRGAKAWATAGGDRHLGEPAVTSPSYGKGHAWYAASSPDAPLWTLMIRTLAERADVSSLGSTPEGLELARRRTRDTDYPFALNHTGKEQPFEAGAEWKIVAESGTADSPALLGPYGFKIFEKKTS